jgi:hypothetical protein
MSGGSDLDELGCCEPQASNAVGSENDQARRSHRTPSIYPLRFVAVEELDTVPREHLGRPDTDTFDYGIGSHRVEPDGGSCRFRSALRALDRLQYSFDL